MGKALRDQGRSENIICTEVVEPKICKNSTNEDTVLGDFVVPFCVLDYDADYFDFVKAMQDNIDHNHALLLRSRGFKEYKHNRFVREKGDIAQIIYFRIERDKVDVFAYYLPICLAIDNAVTFGVQLTGPSGRKLLDGKYYAVISERALKNKEVQCKHYYKNHILELENIYHALEEGVLPEMDQLDSISSLYNRINDKNAAFFGCEYSKAARLNDTFYYVCGLYECLYGDFEKGKDNFQSIIDNEMYLDYKVKEFDLSSKESFIETYNKLSFDGRIFFGL